MRKLFLAFIFISTIASAQQQEKFNGLNMNMGNLFRLSDAKTRSISPENLTGEPGKGGMATLENGNAKNAARDLGQGWKVNPYIIIKPGETFTMAEITGPGAIQHIWMTPTGNWRFSILRFYWDDETEASVEVPVGDFFWRRLGKLFSFEFLSCYHKSRECIQLLLGDAIQEKM